MQKYFLCLASLIFSCKNVLSQDAHYWSSAYSPGAFLTPGATISNNGDSGVLFYNPAVLAYNTKNAAAISGSVYNFQNTKIKNGAGTGLNLNSSNESIIPLLASNTIYLKLNGKPITIAYALIHDPVMRYATSQRRDDKFNVLDDSYSPGPDYFVGQYSKSNSIDQTSFMLAYGRQLSSKLAIGTSFSVIKRKQLLEEDYRSRALINNPTLSQFLPVVTVSDYYQGINTNISLGIKIGLSYNPDEMQHIGLLITAPNIHLYGKASILSDNVINNLKVGNDTLYVLANSRQTNLKSKWKMPISAAAGYTINFGKNQLCFTTEYFASVKEYNVITPKNDIFIRPDTALNIYTTDILKMKDARNAIINFSLACSFPLKDKVTGFCSVRTDFNYANKVLYKDNYGEPANISTWNLYHAQLGANFKKRKFNLRSGVLLSYGSTNKNQQVANYDNPNENNLLLGDAGTSKATYFSIGLLLSYIHNF